MKRYLQDGVARSIDRGITRWVRGRRIEVIVKELRRYMLGCQAYFNFTQVRYILMELDSWVKRRLRCYLWKPDRQSKSVILNWIRIFGILA